VLILNFVYFKCHAIAGICTFSRKMTSFRQSLGLELGLELGLVEIRFLSTDIA